MTIDELIERRREIVPEVFLDPTFEPAHTLPGG
jgi:hypothetical protein